MIKEIRDVRLWFEVWTFISRAVKSKAVDRSAIQFWSLLAKGHSIKFPCHKQSENALVCYSPRQSKAHNFTVSIPQMSAKTCLKRPHFKKYRIRTGNNLYRRPIIASICFQFCNVESQYLRILVGLTQGLAADF